MHTHDRPLSFTEVLSFSNVVLEGHRTKLNQTLPRARKWTRFKNGACSHERQSITLCCVFGSKPDFKKNVKNLDFLPVKREAHKACFFRVVLRRHTGWHIKRVLYFLPKFDDNRPTDGCKKLSYRGDSARWRSLRRSRSFKVTNVDTSRKTVCDFILVNNIDSILLTSHCSPVIAQYFVKLSSPLTKRCLSLTHLFSVISLNIAINHTLPKTRFFGLHFCYRH